MSLVNTLMSGSGVVPTYEGFLSMDELYTGRVCDNYLESYVIDELNEAAVDELVANQEACLVADVIGEVNVIKEGADPQILMEGIFENIKNAIKAFFEKIADFFKNLFTSSKKKAEERSRSEEADNIRREFEEFKASIKDSEAKTALRTSNVIISTYNYTPKMFNVYKTVCDSIATSYTSALDSYKTTLNGIMSKLTEFHASYDKLNKSNKEKFSYMGSIKDDNRFTTTADDRSVSRKHVTNSMNTLRNTHNDVYGNTHGLSDGNKDDMEAWKTKNSAKTRHANNYSAGTAAFKAEYDADVAKLKEKYEESKRPVINGVRLDEDEAKMSLPEYVRYLMHSKTTEKTDMPYAKVADMIKSALDVSDLSDETFLEIAIGGSRSETLKTSIKAANKMIDSVRLMRKGIENMISDAERMIKKNAEGSEHIQRVLNQISNYVRQYATDAAQLSRLSFSMGDEIAAVCRVYLRTSNNILKAQNPSQYAKKREKMSDWEKKLDKDIMSENYGLFEQAYATGLI